MQLIRSVFGEAAILGGGYGDCISTLMLNVQGLQSAWVRLYGPYMDFSYVGRERPEVAFKQIFLALPGAEIIDWSHGRLACISYDAITIAQLAQVVDALLQRMSGLSDYVVLGTLEEWGRV